MSLYNKTWRLLIEGKVVALSVEEELEKDAQSAPTEKSRGISSGFL